MTIALVVQGRLWAFDLAIGLLARGHDVTVFTNYPRWAARRFGLPPGRVRSLPLHGFLSRVVERVAERAGMQALGRWWEPISHRWFGRWAAHALARDRWDVIHCWSGVSEEILAAPGAGTLKLLTRGSSHIAAQKRLLEDERVRVGIPIDMPSEWMVDRELREYALADLIVVLSSFAAQTFEERGIAASRVRILRPGVQTDVFAPSADVLARRLARIRRGDPLSVLFVGALSYRKGLQDLARVIGDLHGDRGRFRYVLVGKILPEATSLVRTLGPDVTVLGKLPQSDLPAAYGSGDVFVFPTIEDGFGVVLAQARAAGLPIVTTPNGAGRDIVETEQDGWIVPIRDPTAIADRLRWCDANRAALADMIEQGRRRASRDWVQVAADFEQICADGERRAMAGEERVVPPPTASVA